MSKNQITWQNHLAQKSAELVCDRQKEPKIGTSGAVHLSQFLIENSIEYSQILKLISLANHGITGDGVKALVEALNPRDRYVAVQGTFTLSSPLQLAVPYLKLHTINLRGNSIGYKGTKYLSTLLVGDYPNLTHLDLYDNSLGNNAVRILLDSLRINSSLKTLNLWYNRINTECAPALASAIKFNTSLKRLLLGGNDLGDQAASLLKNALEYNLSLTEIDLTGNVVSQIKLSALAQRLRRNIFHHRSVNEWHSNNLELGIILDASESKNTITSKRIELTDSQDTVDQSGVAYTSEASLFGFVQILRQSCFENSNLFRSSITKLHNNISRVSLTKLELSEIPSEILEMEQLIYLDLRGNKVSSIPPNISALSNLEALLISHNSIENIPDSIIMLSNLRLFTFHANPLSLIPKIYLEPSYFAEQLTKTPLWKYLNSIRNSGGLEVKIHKSKLIVVGDANVGKTSLLRCLPYDYSSVFTRWGHKLPKPIATDGIDIETIKIKMTYTSNPTQPNNLRDWNTFYAHLLSTSTSPSSPNSTLNGHSFFQNSSKLQNQGVIPSPPSPVTNQPQQQVISFECWDFAGQEVYYATHTLFLTQNTIYLVAFDISKGYEEQHAHFARIDYWIKSIQTRAGVSLSYIILVGTHSDKASLSQIEYTTSKLYERWIKSKDVLNICVISAKTGRGITALKDTIAEVANKFGLTNQLFPKSFLQIGDILKGIKTSQPWITYEKLLEISQQFNIDRITTDTALIPALQDLGTILHFKDAQLRDTIFVDPQFICKAFADVLTIKHRGFIKSDGILRQRDLHHLWQGTRKQVPEAMLIKLFEQFDVAIRLDDERLLVPALLSDGAPNYLNDHWPFELDSTKEIVPNLWQNDSMESKPSLFARHYRFKFLPFGFFPKLMSQCFHSCSWEVVCHWKTGIMCRTSSERALLTFDDKTFLLVLRVLGDRFSPLLTLLVEVIDTLIKGWYPSASYEVLIPFLKSYSLKREQILDAVRAAKDGTPILHIHTSSDFVETLRADQIAPDLCLSGLSQLSVEDISSNLSYESVLGRGGHGTVWKGSFQSQPVAIKVFESANYSPDDFATSEEYLDSKRSSQLKSQLCLQHEVLVLNMTNHPNIVPMIGFNIHKSILVMELVKFGNLETYLSVETSQLSPHLKFRIAFDVAKAMNYLHGFKPPIVHRDLAANNVMISSLDESAKVVAKVVDFGTATVVGKLSLGNFSNEKWYCLSPEVLEGKDHSHKSDVYSYSIVLWQLLTGKFTHDLGPRDIMNGLRPQFEASNNDSNTIIELYQDLIERCWAQNPADRPDFVSVCASLVNIGRILGIDQSFLNTKEVLSPESNELHLHAIERTSRFDLNNSFSSPRELSPSGYRFSQDSFDSSHSPRSSLSPCASKPCMLSEVTMWQDTNVLSLSNPSSESHPHCPIEANSIEVTSICTIYPIDDNNVQILVGGSDGVIRYWVVHPDSTSQTNLPISLEDPQNPTSDYDDFSSTVVYSEKLFDGALMGITQIDSSRFLCYSGFKLAIVELCMGQSSPKFLVSQTSSVLATSVVKVIDPQTVLIASSTGTVAKWTVSPFERTHSIQLKTVSSILSLSSLDEDSNLIWVAFEDGFAVLDLTTFELLSSKESSIDLGQLSAFCSFENFLWCGMSNGFMSIYRYEYCNDTNLRKVTITRSPVATFRPDHNRINAIARSGSRIATAGQDSIHWWDPISLQIVEKPLSGLHRAPISHLSMISETMFLSASMKEGTVICWNYTQYTSPSRTIQTSQNLSL